MFCTIASLPVCTPGSDCPVAVVSVRPGGAAGLRINVASATSTTPDSNTNNSDFATYTVTPRAEVTVSKTVTPASPAAGQEFTYVVTAKNEPDGRSTADNVTIEDTLPDGLIFIAATPSTGSCSTRPTPLSETRSGNNKVICNLGSIASGAQQTVQIIVRPSTRLRGQDITNLVKVETSTPGDTDPDVNFPLTTPIQNPAIDLQVSKIDSPDPLGIGETMTYTVTVNNNGPSAAENVVVTDTLPPRALVFRSYTVPPDGNCTEVPQQNVIGGTLTCNFPVLPANQSRVITITMRGDTKDVVDNVVEVSSDESELGFDTDDENDRHVETTTITTRVDLQVTKTPSSPVVAVNEPFSFTITLLNRQDGALTESENTQLTDTLPAGMELTGAPAASIVNGTASQNSCSGAAGGTSFVCNFGTVSSGGRITINVPVRITVVPDPPQISNTATALTTSLDIDGLNNSATGTVTVNVTPGARLGINKVFDSHEDVDGNGFISQSDRLTYTITATNTGTITLTDVVVTDARITPDSETCASVTPGGTCVLTGTLTVTAEDAQNGEIVNVATADSAETGPEQASLSVAVLQPGLTVTKVNTGHEDVDGSGAITQSDRLTYAITATNTGTATLTNVVVTDSRITPSSETCASVAVGGACVLTGSLTVTAADAQAGRVVNTATADSNETEQKEVTLTVPVVRPGSGTTLSKTASVTTVKRGERVPYVITAQNVRISPVRIVDIMPPGFAYDEASGKANGARVSPVINGRSLTFDGLTPDAKGSIRLELTLIATASAAVGDNVNQAQLIDPASGEVVASARARVTLLEEAVFDCSDVIGKVFDDKNRNGYQDEGEPGLPGVRLATVRGLLVTTDPHGRFSIACADIPDAGIGSNFIVKLDVRTLPTGYLVTTENPRRVRLTRGKVVKLDFGAAINRLVKLDINDKVFEPGGTALKPKWQAGLDRLITALAAEPSSLRITYVGEDRKLARARLKSIIREIEQRWDASGGGYRLPIETRVTGGKAAP
jgi:uncharacterized repeat protein (TIGR01451 family)